jgi:hypothetical protein
MFRKEEVENWLQVPPTSPYSEPYSRIEDYELKVSVKEYYAMF